MSRFELSVLIPAKNEMFLPHTVEDIINNSSEKCEVIAVIDGGNYIELPQHERVTVVYLQKSVGQRAATNIAARLSKSKWVAKADAHCAFDKDFDTKLLADAQDNQVIVPAMLNLHAFNWVCEKGHKRYQGPSGPCHHCIDDVKGSCKKECGLPTKRDVLWYSKPSPRSRSYCFDPEPHFYYFGEYLKGKKDIPDITETMSLQGSFFMLTRKKYWELSISDESMFSSWGSQGIEVAVKARTTGMSVVCNNKTWYAHLFRTQGGDFSFPYAIKHEETIKNRKRAKDYFFDAKWRKQVYPLSSILEKFWPIGSRWEFKDYLDQKVRELKIDRAGICSIENRKTGSYWVYGAKSIRDESILIEKALKEGTHPNPELQRQWNEHGANSFWWHVEMFCREASLDKFVDIYEEKVRRGELSHPRIEPVKPVTKGILYYTDGICPKGISGKVQESIKKAGLPITSVSLVPIDFGDRRIVLPLKRSVLTMAKQILAGLEAMTEDVVFFCEHDCLYDVSCFNFIPPKKSTVYYNVAVWKASPTRDYALKVDDCRQLSGLCAYRDILIEHYRKRVARLESEGWSVKIGHEPGTHNRKERIDNLRSDTWKSVVPIVDIRDHGTNVTKTKWRKEDFRNQKYTVGWDEQKVVPGYGRVDKLVKSLCEESA